MNATNPDPLKAVCAWCKKVTREGRPPVSHGICPDCREKVLAKHGLRAKPATPADAGRSGVEIDEALAREIDAATTADAQACLQEGLEELVGLNNQLYERVRLAEQAEALARAERDMWRRAAMGHGVN